MKDIDKKLDTIHSIFIRLRDTDENGKGQCYTCGYPVTYYTGQCGHYPNISRENTQFRWSEKTCKIQCESCNCFNDGLAEPFRDRLVSELGFEGIARIEFDSRKPFKWFKSEKIELLKLRRKQCKELLKDKNLIINIP